MFNRQPFNRGKFNRSVNVANSVFLYGEIDLELGAAGKLNASNTFKGNAALSLTTTGKATYSANLKGDMELFLFTDGQVTRLRPFEGNADISIAAEGKIVRARIIGGDALLSLTVGNEGFNTFRYEIISLPGLLIGQGDELIIDMENMTITLNGQNAMRYLSRDSEFFRLNPGNNEITYHSTVTAGRVDLRILWKDAWV